MVCSSQQPRKKANCVCSTINIQELLNICFRYFECHLPLFETSLPTLSTNYGIWKSHSCTSFPLVGSQQAIPSGKDWPILPAWVADQNK